MITCCFCFRFQNILAYQWLEDSLRLGEKVSEDSYRLKEEPGENVSHQSSAEASGHANENSSGSEEVSPHKKLRSSPPLNLKDSTKALPEDSRDSSAESKELHGEIFRSRSYDGLSDTSDAQTANFNVAGISDKEVILYDFL